MKPASKATMSPPELAILSHVEAFGLTVVEACERLDPFVDGPIESAKRMLASLIAKNALFTTDLYPGRTAFFQVVPQGTAKPASSYGSSGVAAPSQQSKIRRFAMLSFCCLGVMPRQPLTMVQLQALATVASGLNVRGPYYYQPSPTPLCGFLRVDMGGDGRWDRVLAKCAKDVRQHARLPEWQPLIAARCFEITLATALPQKAERLCRAFRDMTPPPAAPIRIAVIPELLYLIVPPPEQAMELSQLPP